MRLVLLLIGSGLMIACTPMEWRRGGEVATVDSEVYRKCQSYASLEGMRRMPLFGSYPSPAYVGLDRSGRPVYVSPSWTRADQVMLEHMTMMQCMVGQGFDLVPIAPEAKKEP